VYSWSEPWLRPQYAVLTAGGRAGVFVLPCVDEPDLEPGAPQRD